MVDVGWRTEPYRLSAPVSASVEDMLKHPLCKAMGGDFTFRPSSSGGVVHCPAKHRAVLEKLVQEFPLRTGPGEIVDRVSGAAAGAKKSLPASGR